MNIFITFISTLLLYIYFQNDYLSAYGKNAYDAQFIGISLIYASIPIMIIGAATYFIAHENRAKAWTHVSGVVTDIREKRFLFRRFLKIEYSYHVNDIRHINDTYSTRKEWCQLGYLMLNPALKNGKPETWKGKRIKVYYNKNNYWDSVISRELKMDTSMLLAPSLNMMIIVIYVVSCLAYKL